LPGYQVHDQEELRVFHIVDRTDVTFALSSGSGS
jgi:hypothetical protein